MISYEPLDDDDKECFNYEIKLFNLTKQSLFKEFYVRRTDKFPFELWNTQMINITFEQLRDYLVDIEEIMTS